MHRFARDDAWGLGFHLAALGGGDRALAVDRIAQPIDHAAQQRLADRHVDDRAGAGDGVALAHFAVIAEDHDADVVRFQVQRHALDAGARKFDQFALHHVLQAEHAGDAVTDGQHLAGFRDVRVGIERRDLLLENFRDLGWADFHRLGNLHGVLQALQPGFETGIVEPRADLHDQPA